MPHLEAHLQLRFPLQDDHTRQSVIIDLLLSYNARPTVYDPNRLSLFSFLRMAARRDMLNALSKKRRHNRRVLGDDVIDKHPWSSDENVMLARLALAEWLDEQTNLSFEQVIAELEARLTEEEKNILRLMLDGERSTAQFAEVMGISHLDEPVQRYRVKRMKDRIKKRLRRFGRAIGRN
jgi:RNA polymerase sigma factor (sigma-70 family)